MKIRISSVSVHGVGELINNVTTNFEDRLRPALSEKNYGGGIEQLSAFFISVGSDPGENAPYCQMHNKSGRYKDLLSNKMVRYVSVAIPVDPNCILKAPRENLPRMLGDLLVKQIELPAYELPEGFNYKQLSADLKIVLGEP